SRTISRSIPSATAGRRFAKTSSSFRSRISACSGRTRASYQRGPPTAPTRTASAWRHAVSVTSGSGRPYWSIAAPPNGSSWKPMPNAISTRTASDITSGPTPSPGRQTTLCAMDLLAGQVEHVPEELGDTGGRERAGVRGLQLDDELLLALVVAQRDPLRALVLVQRAHELEPLVHRGEQLAVGRADLLPELGELVHAMTPSSSSSASTSASISTTEPVSCSATACGVFRPVPVTSATTRSDAPISPASAAARSAPTVTPTAVSPKTPACSASIAMFWPTSSSGTAWIAPPDA